MRENIEAVVSHHAWETLHLFPTRTERFVALRWYWLLISPIALSLAIAIHMNGRRTPWGFDFTPSWFLNDPHTITLTLGLTVCGILFGDCERRIRALIPTLLVRGVLITLHDDVESAAEQHRLVFEQRLRSPFRYAVIAATIAFAATAAFLLHMDATIRDWIQSSREAPHEAHVVVTFIALQFATLFLWSYAVGAVCWCFLCTARFITEIPHRFGLLPRLGDADNCGGFRDVGACCMSMAMPLVVGGGVLTIWLLLPDAGQTTAEITSIGLIAFVFPLSIFVFVAPLWSIHVTLVSLRQEYEDRYSAQISRLLNHFHVIAETTDTATAKLTGDRITAYRTLSPDSVKFPKWPFDQRIVARLTVPQVLGVAAAALKMLH